MLFIATVAQRFFFLFYGSRSTVFSLSWRASRMRSIVIDGCVAAAAAATAVDEQHTKRNIERWTMIINLKVLSAHVHIEHGHTVALETGKIHWPLDDHMGQTIYEIAVLTVHTVRGGGNLREVPLISCVYDTPSWPSCNIN